MDQLPLRRPPPLVYLFRPHERKILRTAGSYAVPRRRIVRVSMLCELAYASQQKNPLVRNVSRSQKIRMRLGGSPEDIFGPIPERPRGMWRRTYERHCAVLARIEGNLFV